MTPNIDALNSADNDADYIPDADDDDSAYHKLICLSLRNINRNRKIPPKTKTNNMTPNADSHHADYPDAAKDDAYYP